MMKRILSVLACLALVATLVPAFALNAAPVSAYSIHVMPNTDGKTNNQTYVLGAGTDAEVTVKTDWRSTSMSPTATMTPKYIAIHCTGSYPSTSTALGNHNYGKTASNACWHYTVGHDSIYQMLADNRQGWHVGTSYTGAPSNSNSIGLELAVNGFPADEAYGGEHWSDGTAIMQWWENQFNQTMKNAAYLVAVLCERWDLDYSTRVKMHWDSKSYQSGAAGKDCPMQMRATYDKTTNTFARAGEYSDGRDGYFWQMFWGYLEAYLNGATSVDSGSNATKIGTYQITPSDGLNVRSTASASGTLLGNFEQGAIAEITELADNGWGKTTLPDGQVGWCAITQYGKYIGVDAQAYDVSTTSAGLAYSYDTDGALVVTNTSTTDQGQLDMFLPQSIGTNTTPYMNLQVTPISGSGYYFGITQKNTGWWMIRDCNSADQLVNAWWAPYMTNQETLSISMQEWWKPTEKYNIDQVRFYVAPNTSIKINYFYFTVTGTTVTDSRYNLRSAASNVNLMQPDTLGIVDATKSGSYSYSNGMLKVISDTADGYQVQFDVDETFDANKLKRLLVAIESNVPFDISLQVTHAGGVGIMSLVSDYYPALNTTPVNGYIPAWSGSAGLDLYNYYAWNQIMPADGMSTVQMITVKLGGAGTLYLNSLQLSENDRILNFRDGVYKEDYSPKEEPTPPEPVGMLGDVDGDGSLSTADARMVLQYGIGSITLTEAQIALCDYDQNGLINTADARDILIATL